MTASQRQVAVQRVIDRCKMALHMAECAKNSTGEVHIVYQMVKATKSAHDEAISYGEALAASIEAAKTN